MSRVAMDSSASCSACLAELKEALLLRVVFWLRASRVSASRLGHPDGYVVLPVAGANSDFRAHTDDGHEGSCACR